MDDKEILKAFEILQRRLAEGTSKIAELKDDLREAKRRAADDARFCREAKQRRDADAGHILWLQTKLRAAEAEIAALTASSKDGPPKP